MSSRVADDTGHQRRLFVAFFRREFRQRFLGSLTGPAWALLQPLLLLGIYALVFIHVLRVRLPAGEDRRTRCLSWSRRCGPGLPSQRD